MKLTEQERQDIYLAHYPTVQEIEAYLDYCEYEPTVKVIKLKLAATKTVPTALEKTTSVGQLVKLGSPLMGSAIQHARTMPHHGYAKKY